MHGIFVTTNDALFEHRHDGRHQHVIGRINDALPCQGIKGILDFRHGVGSGRHAQGLLQQIFQGSTESAMRYHPQIRPGIGTGQGFWLATNIDFGHVNVGIKTKGIERIGIAKDGINRFQVQIHAGQGTFPDVIGKGGFHVAAGIGCIGRPQVDAGQQVLAYRRQGLQAIGKTMAGHRRHGKSLLKQTGGAIAQIGHHAAHHGRPQGNMVDRHHTAGIGIFNQNLN